MVASGGLQRRSDPHRTIRLSRRDHHGSPFRDEEAGGANAQAAAGTDDQRARTEIDDRARRQAGAGGDHARHIPGGWRAELRGRGPGDQGPCEGTERRRHDGEGTTTAAPRGSSYFRAGRWLKRVQKG